MNPASDIPPSRRVWTDWILVGVFLSLLWAPTADKVFHLDGSRASGENRLPARPPKVHELGASHLQQWLAGSEAYFNDHFGFRNQLIRWFQNWKLAIYQDGGVDRVVIGPNRWLFTGEQKMVDHYLGLLKFSPQGLQDWQTMLEKRRDWLAARGIKYLFVIPPDKQTIYPEQLPVWLVNAAPANRETKLAQFLQYMNEHSTVAILDLRQPLNQAKATAPTYLQHDTHWNAFGGFVACQEVINSLMRWFPDLPPLRLEDFTWTNTPTTGGDLAGMLGRDVSEENFYRFAPRGNLPRLNLYQTTNIISTWDFHKPSRISENPAPVKTTAVIFHDSFGNTWQQFLGFSFKRIVFMSENREFNSAVILGAKPDLVINEMVERYFNTLDPQELLAHDGLP